MASESVIRRQTSPADSVAEEDYRSFCEALSSSARGRAFLEEFTRRNRQADTEVVLTALKRIEASARQQAAASPEADRIRQDLRALLDTLRVARPQSENSPSAIKAATLAALIDFAQARIEALVMPAASGETEALAAVPEPDQPELPIPHPTATLSPVMALVQSALRASPEANKRAEPEASLPAAGAAPAYVSPQARRKSATVVPIVEFDYRAHQSGRPASIWSAPEDAWTALAPPAVSSPIVAPMVATPVIAEPVIAPPPVEAPEAAPAAEVETYELWLDPPAVASAEPASVMSAGIVSELVPDLASVPEKILNHVTSEMMLPELTAAATAVTEAVAIETVAFESTVSEITAAETIISEAAVSETPVADAVPTDAAPPQDGGDAVPTAEAAISTIETLMQQMESAAAPAPAVRGHAEVNDPLAPLMALSEEERIALFT